MNTGVSKTEKSGVQFLEEALEALLRQLLGAEAEGIPDSGLRWEMPKNAGFGDLSNAVGFRLAAKRRAAPQQIAQELATGLMQRIRGGVLADWIERIEVIQGYMNAFLSQPALVRVLREVLSRQGQFGLRQQANPKKINIEFLSANPTGPLSVAHGRQATVGDILARIFISQGYAVTKEYYLNDEGNQIELLARSLRARCRELCGFAEPFPEDGYHGEYLYDTAKAFIEQHGKEVVAKPEAETFDLFLRFGCAAMLQDIRSDLQRYGLVFDQWSSQEWVRTSGRIDKALEELRARGALYENDGALWFASSRYGDDKDRVVRKSDGVLTYLTPDIAYHQWKYERGYDALINLWGPDHHGYIARMKAAMSALGLAAGKLDVRIVQLVTLSRQGKPVRMSKRTGNFVTFREVLDEVGVDATRFFFVMRTMDSHLDFDLDLATEQSQENPVYYIQYAHARICSILAKAPAEGSEACLELLAEPEERLLIRALFQYPVVLHLCALGAEPHGLTVYLRRLAETFHVFYTKHRVIGDNPDLNAARLALIRAVRQVLHNGLGLLGISAPERM